MTLDASLPGSLRDEIRSVLAPLVQGCRRWALLDYPAYANVGDTAIWLGSLKCLRDMGLPRPSYVSDAWTFDPEHMARKVGDGTLFVKGGGNFGDLYPVHQRFREKLAKDFQHNRIIQLPQTVHFGEPGTVARARRALSSHPNFTLLVRDPESLEFVKRELDVQAHLCPDLAFGLGQLSRSSPPTRDILWLLRSDEEAAEPGHPIRKRSTDWPGDDFGLGKLQHQMLRKGAAGAGPLFGNPLRSALALTYGPTASIRLRRGIALLSSARSVVTDRLHGHILCLLLGIPHILLNDRHGKVFRFHSAWTDGCPLAVRARSLDEASAMVSERALPRPLDSPIEPCI